jgi:hypothetical protein
MWAAITRVFDCATFTTGTHHSQTHSAAPTISTVQPTHMNTTVTITLTPEQRTALADALYIRAMDLQANVHGTDRNVAMNEVAACLLDQMDYPVHEWMSA